MPPPKTDGFLSRKFHGCPTPGRILLKKTHIPLSSCVQRNTVPNDDVGVSRGTVFQEIRPGAGFEIGDFVNEKLGGYRRTTQEMLAGGRCDFELLLKHPRRPGWSRVRRMNAITTCWENGFFLYLSRSLGRPDKRCTNTCTAVKTVHTCV